MVIYGALIEHRTPDERADIDAELEGRPAPSQIRAEQDRQAAIWAIAMDGEIAGVT